MLVRWWAPSQRVEKVLGAIRYAPQLEAAVGWIQGRLQGAPYVALQWRTEKAVHKKTPARKMMHCARAAIARVKGLQRGLLKKYKRPGHVFLATDIAANGRCSATPSCSLSWVPCSKKAPPLWLLSSMAFVCNGFHLS